MVIEIQDYNLIKVEKLVIQKCIDNNPTLSLEQQADLLHISSRTLFRRLKDFNIIRNANSIDKSIKRLERLGYKVSKE